MTLVQNNDPTTKACLFVAIVSTIVVEVTFIIRVDTTASFAFEFIVCRFAHLYWWQCTPYELEIVYGNITLECLTTSG